MKREYYSDTISAFLEKDTEAILGALATSNQFALEPSQRDSWLTEVQIMKSVLVPYQGQGKVYFEFSIPRLGKRIDVLVLIGPVIFILEFKIGEREFTVHAIDQAWDYALDLKNFHESSHEQAIAPILVATEAKVTSLPVAATPKNDRLLVPIATNDSALPDTIRKVLQFVGGPAILPEAWERGRYCPTPTIIEAATALY